jgi:hypothetical protein
VTTLVDVYRPNQIATNRFGDPVDADGNVVRPENPHTYLGQLEVVLAGTQAEAILPRLTGSGGGSVDRAEAADVTSTIGAPRNAAFKLQNGDRVVIADETGQGLVYAVVGPRLYATQIRCPGGGIASTSSGPSPRTVSTFKSNAARVVFPWLPCGGRGGVRATTCGRLVTAR